MQGLQVPTVVTVGRAAMDDAFTGIAADATRQRVSRMVSEVIRFVRMHRLLILDELHHAERHAQQERTAGV